MADVADRVAPRSRGGIPSSSTGSLGRGAVGPGSGAGAGAGFADQNELKSILFQVEPLPHSANLSRREVEDIIQSTIKMVGNTDVDWNKRLTMLKTFRSLCADPTHLPTIKSLLRPLTPPFEQAVKDLRSTVSREACLTVAYISKQLGAQSDIFFEPILDTLFKLLVANAKVVSITGAQTIQIIYEFVPSWRILPPLKTQMASRAKEVRKAVCNVLKLILTSWPEELLRKQMNNGESIPEVLKEVMKRGLSDADPEARQSARESFPAFQHLFPELAGPVIDGLEPNKKRQLQASLSTTSTAAPMKPAIPAKPNGLTATSSAPSCSLTRQGSLIKKTCIPVLSSRISPAKVPSTGFRSASAIDVQAVNRATARQQQQQVYHTNTGRSPLKVMGRTNSSIAAPVSVTPKYSSSSTVTSPTHGGYGQYGQSYGQSANSSTLDRSRNRSKSRISQSQPGSRSNSPSSRYAYASYQSPYAQSRPDREPTPNFISPPPPRGLGIARTPHRNNTPGSGALSASNSRDTSPTGRGGGIFNNSRNHRSRSVTTPTHYYGPGPSPSPSTTNNSATAKMLLASREAESSLGPALNDSLRDYHHSIMTANDHSDSEDSMSSHRSFRSETFSPGGNGGGRTHFFVEENVEELIHKCGSPKWSERKDGLNGLHHYLDRYGSIPQQFMNRLGQTFCRIFMDAHTKVLGVFLDVLNAVLARHARDLVDFTQILLNRILTKLGSDLLQSVHTKLSKTLEIILNEMPPAIQFSAVTNYLCDPVQTPNSRSRIAALTHLYDLSNMSITVKITELAQLVDKILDWSTDPRASELRRNAKEVFLALFDMAAPQMTLVLGQLPYSKQDQANALIRTAHNSISSGDSGHGFGVKSPGAGTNTSGSSSGMDTVDWNGLASDIQNLRLSDSNPGIVRLLNQVATCHPNEKSRLVTELHAAIKSSSDDVLLENHRELLRVLLSSTTIEVATSPRVGSYTVICFQCLEELCSRPALSQVLSGFTELLIVRVTDVQVPNPLISREISKAAENCGLAIAINFRPETITKCVCPIVANRDFPVNLMAIKMLQRLTETCEISKLRALVPDLMHTLVSAYEHPDSAVRKSAVFAIVAVHLRFSKSELEPYLSPLSGSKLKLLDLYIQRAQQQNSNISSVTSNTSNHQVVAS